MSGKNRYVTDPSVINVYGLLMAELSALKAQFGLSELSIVVRDGRYFLEADGRLIEITFINGKIIPMDVWENLQPLLGQLLEQNGFSPVAQFGEYIHPPYGVGLDQYSSIPMEMPTGFGFAQNGLGLFGFVAGSAMLLSIGSNGRSLQLSGLGGPMVSGPMVEGITKDDAANTVTVDFDRELDPAKLPSTDDFEILVNGQKAGVRGIRIDSDKVELELARDLQPSDQVTVRYLDQTGDLENSIQGVDGSLAGSFYQGLVIDGYIAGAQLYIDKNGDGVPDPDEILEGVTTDERGVFLLDGTLNPDNLPILVTGGTNTDTGLPNNTILSAPAGATVITPTTTLIQKMVREGLVSGADDAAKVKAAQSAIKTALGLTEDIDLLSFDPIAAIKNQEKLPAGATLHKFNTSVIEILESFGKATSANFNKAADGIANEIIQAASESRELEIDASFTDAIVDKVFTSGDNVALKTNLGLVVEAIQNASSLNEIATAQTGIAVQIESEPITNDPTPIVFGTATVGATVNVAIAGATYEITSGPDGKWRVDTGSATPTTGVLAIEANGQNSVSVSATDAAGNTSSTVSQILEIDTTAPTIISASFDFGGVLNITKAAATGTLTVETTGVEDGQSVTLTLGTKTFLGTVNNNLAKVTVPSGSLQSLQEGIVTYKVDVSDAAGNAATQYSDSFSYDGTPPTLAIAAPIKGDDVVNASEDDDVLVSGTTSADNGQTVTITFKDSSNATVMATATVSNGAWTLSGSEADISALTNGPITVTADVSDDAGNAATQAIKTITLDNVAPSAPTLALTADTNNTSDGVTSDATVDVTGIETNATWEYSVNNGDSWTTGTGSSFEVPEGTYADGYIQVRRTDVAGNDSTVVGALSGALTVDTTDPAVAITSADLTNDATPVVSGTAETDATVTVVIAGVTYEVTATGGTWSVDTGSATPTSGTLAINANGTNSVSVTATDAAGNTSSAVTQTLTVDTTNPAVASDAAVVTTTAADGTPKTTDLKETDKVVLTIAMGEDASNLSNMPTGTDSTVVKVDGTAVTSNWSTSGSDLLLTYTVVAGVNGAITVDETALATALTNAGITDGAGNALTVPTFATVTDPTNVINADDVFFEGLIVIDDATSIDSSFVESSTPGGTDESGDNTAKLVLDVSDGSDGDTVELYVDNDMVFSETLSTTEIANGTITTGELTFNDTTNQDVALEIKVQNSSGTYIQDNGDVVWEYQW